MSEIKENAVGTLRQLEYRLVWLQAYLGKLFRGDQDIGYIRKVPALTRQIATGNQWCTVDKEFLMHDVTQYSNPLTLDCAIRYLIVENSMSRVQIEITQEFESGHLRTQTLKQIQMKEK